MFGVEENVNVKVKVKFGPFLFKGLSICKRIILLLSQNLQLGKFVFKLKINY